MAGRATKEKSDKIGSIIKEKRKKLEISQLDLAIRAETSQSAINEYEQGKRKPSNNTLQRLAKALNTTVPVLLGEVPDTDIHLNADEIELFSLLHRLNADNQKNAVQMMKNMIETLFYAQEGSNIESTKMTGIQRKK
ncbi:MAG: helix-turn-helix domain-containing protein [Lacrimispora saccharolytica]